MRNVPVVIRAPVLFLTLVGGILSAAPRSGSAQGVEETLAALATENARLYLEPLTRGLAFALNGSAFDRAAPLGRLGFDLGARFTVARVPPEGLEFEAIRPSSVEFTHPLLGTRTYDDPYAPRGGSLTTPTLFGSGSPLVLEPTGSFRQDLLLAGENPSDYNLPFPEGLIGTPAVPFAILQGALGIGFGTELTGLYVPEVTVRDEVGALRAEGFGIRHGLSHWFVSPVSLSVGYQQSTLQVGEYLDASARQFSLHSGIGVGPLSLMGAATMRSADVEVRYTVNNPDGVPGLPPHGATFSFRSDLPSTVAFGAGLRLQLLFLNLAAGYAVDEYDTFSLKIGIGIP